MVCYSVFTLLVSRIQKSIHKSDTCKNLSFGLLFGICLDVNIEDNSVH